MASVRDIFSRHRWRILILVLLMCGLGSASWLWITGWLGPSAGPGRGFRAATVAVETAPVEMATLRDLRNFTGTLHARAAFDVAAKIGGRLESLTVDIGDRVAKGQVVARLDDEELVHEVQQAKAELGVAQAAFQEARSLLEVRESQLRRSRELFKKGIGAEAALESAQVARISQQARVEVAQAQVTQRQAALSVARVRLSHTVIRVDWSHNGERRVVGERYVDEGEMLTANKPLFSVLDITALTAVMFASEADYALLRPGLDVTLVADAYPNRKFQGRIARIAPQFRQESRQARMEVTVPNPERLLKPGMYVRVEVEISRAEGARVVPLQSVVDRNGRKGVFLVEGEPPVARFVPVRTGLAQQNQIQVIEPDLKGRVVNLGQHLLQDGSPVRLVDAPSAPGTPPATADGGKPTSGARK